MCGFVGTLPGRAAASWRCLSAICICASIAAGLGGLLAGCTTPIKVQRMDPGQVERQLESNVISTGRLSEATRIVLHHENLSDQFETDPEGARASLHSRLAAGKSNSDMLYALAEMSFLQAAASGQHHHSLSSAVYAYAFLFPNDPKGRPSAFDPRFRAACDIYNRSITRAFASADRSRLELRSGRFPLSFGTIDVTFDPARSRWGDQVLSNFTPADELGVTGLNIRYRRPGIGASLAADATPPAQEKGFQVEPDVKVPVTALLRVEAPWSSLPTGRLRGTIEIYPAFEPSEVAIAGQTVPLEADTTTAFAFSLSDPKVWKSELAGFFDGSLFDRSATQLVGLEPYRRGQIPVVFIHGTGSRAGRWANLINDLQSDAAIREGFQFWAFSYATGNPTSFSAERLRAALEEAVFKLDPHGTDPALRQIVLIGHSQGGLLAKWMTIDSESRLWDTVSDKPPEQLRLSEQNKSLLRRIFFVQPLPEVRRVIFIATPHHGSFVADDSIAEFVARFVTPGGAFLTALSDLTQDNAEQLNFRPASTRFGSVWSMSPSQRVAAHSIIAIKGNGPAEAGDDGVVSYQSAHIPEAASELVVRSGHSVQSDPHTVNEVRRILLLHLAEACRKGCVPGVVTDRVQPAPYRSDAGQALSISAARSEINRFSPEARATAQ